jgi:glycosyltransferase involved in cell wall biosynthesis
MKAVAQFVFSDLKVESRVYKEADALISAGIVDTAICFGRGPADLTVPHKSVDGLSIRYVKSVRVRYLPRRVAQIIEAVKWTYSVVRAAKKMRPVLIQAHDLSALPAGVLAKWMTKAKLHYDAHELGSERTGWPSALRYFARSAERALVPHVDLFTTVSPSIASWYAREFGCEMPTLVLNATENVDIMPVSKEYFRSKYSIPHASLVFIYVGLMDKGRGIDWILKVFSRKDCLHHVVFMGFGALAEKVGEASRSHANIHIHEAVPPNEVARYSAGADVGLVTIEPVSQSYLYAMPNKMFECRLAGIPVIVTNLPDMAKMIEAYGGGWAIKPDAEALEELIDRLNRHEIDSISANSRPFPTWTDAKTVLVNAVRKALGA